MTTFSNLDDLRSAVGSELGDAGPVVVSQERINEFAEVTGDHQWIHVDQERAASSVYGSTIAHGYLTLSLIAPFLEELLVVEQAHSTINYGFDSVRFPAPVPAGSSLIARGVLVDVVDKPGGAEVRVQITIAVPDATKPACVATVVIRVML